MTANVADFEIKRFVQIWAQAAVIQYERSRLCYENRTDRQDPMRIVDVVFLLEALVQLYAYLELCRRRGLVHEQKIEALFSDADRVRKLRNMNIHRAEYQIGKGHNQENFVASTPFRHDGTTIQWINGYLLIGDGLNASTLINHVIKLNEMVDPRSGSLWRRPSHPA